MKRIAAFLLWILATLSPVVAQTPTWSRFAPPEAAEGMEEAAMALEAAIADFAATTDEEYERLAAGSRLTTADLSGLAAQFSESASSGAQDASESEPADDPVPSRIEGVESDTGLRSPIDPWSDVEAAYGDLRDILHDHPPGGGTVAFSEVEGYLLSVQRRLGEDFGRLVAMKRGIAELLSELRQRDTIVAYLESLTEEDSLTQGASQTHLQFLLQEAMAEWWLEVLFTLDPGERVSAMRRQQQALAAIGAEAPAAADFASVAGATADQLERRAAHYLALADLDEDAPARFTVSSLIGAFSIGAAGDAPLLGEGAVVVRGLSDLGTVGATAAFERYPAYRLSVRRLAESLSVLSSRQRLRAAERLGVAYETLESAYATSAGLVEARVVGTRREEVESLLTLARRSYDDRNVSERADQTHESYRADGRAALRRLESYLAPDSGATDDQVRWSTLAVIENRHAQRIVAEGESPRVRDHLDAFVRRIYERVDPAVISAIRRDVESAFGDFDAGHTDEPETFRQFRAMFPASAREGTPRVRLIELPTAGPHALLPYDRTVAVEIVVESDRGAVRRWVAGDVVAEYYSSAYLEATRATVEADAASRLRWMHMHGQSASSRGDVDGEPFSDEWFDSLEDLILAVARPWLDRPDWTVDFVQQADFRARAYARVLEVVEVFVSPALSVTRPAMRLGVEARRLLEIMRAVASADKSTHLGESELAALLTVAPPGTADFTPSVLLGAIVGAIADCLAQKAATDRLEFQFARTAELAEALPSIGPGDVLVDGFSFLGRVDTYLSRGWIRSEEASILRKGFYDRVANRGSEWSREQ